ncbi:MAG: c-type cytochrome, partial [Terriglobales bacterium]
MHTSLLKWSLWLGVVVALCLSIASYAQLTTYQQQDWLHSPAATSHIGNITGNPNAAALPYRRYCVGCHGDLGDGNGENMQWINPKPRDFQLAIFKCRSTPTGTLPTDEDLFNTIGRGLDRSNMPSWNPLTKQERADLVAWIKHFSPRWQNEKAGTPIQIPPEPEITPDRVKTGQEVFRKMECWKCHGVQGMANGPSSSTLTDDLGRPISPFNFTDGSRPLCGSTDQDIYKIFMTGLDGTPMPS